MSTDTVITVHRVAKKFKLFSSARERLFESLHPLRKRYHKAFWALHDVSLEVSKGEIIAVLGRNGSGKSTLLQIICQIMQATRGAVVVKGKISALLELGAGFNPEFTGRENVILNGSIMGFSRAEMHARMADIERFAEIGEHFDQPVKTYSSGMFVRVAFAAAIHVDPEILILDEALSVGDARFQHRCFQRIRELVDQGKTILFVSHSADTVLRLCQRGVVIEQGRVSFDGPIVAAVNHYQHLLAGGAPQAEPDNAAPVALAPRGISALENADQVCRQPFYNNHETRLGNGTVQIIDISISVDGRPLSSPIRTGQRVELLLSMRFNETLAGVSAGFAIVTLDGTYVFGTNLLMRQALLLSAQAGEHRQVRFSFCAGLIGADYFLDLGCNQITAQDDLFLDVRRSVLTLRFADTPGITGIADLQVQHEIL
ncbi:ABC transporter ATP-binding protein [Pseudomonas turukhanskensis]|uniref:Sugar ABC transporter ATP-binding protein n=1 Tax=Pseudomonas turukhanskensis TaxID=1806536 RepID=A0A9W6K575_9PSED|nr:ABC transporter ATP-binding protein [Pseudomonas turukhanskensis]GLK87739.1 sugar ABC transporter ATP-binding protein [Pseudomonas turukhanskensis]